ncbi:MAG: SDR family oxidoreductase [Gemmatimonadales bacterium]|jgi:3-oxoacyl-[acyl-carrier protein] reductase|nr:SDR family oxidoreductase [Gemmatimonadales bacterium]
MDLKLGQRAALVCGSSSGLGLAIAEGLAQEGCRVALNGRDPDRLERATRTVAASATADVTGFAADVSDPAAVATLVTAVERHFGHLDILICNAGGPPATSFRNAAPETWQAALDLNLLSTINLCRAAIAGMRARHWGRIVCLTSIAAKQPLGDLILSTTARAGVVGFAKALADEVATDGVTVNVILPGYMRTERVQELQQQRAANLGQPAEEITRRLVEHIPMKRMGEPSELAAVVAFLASDRASYVTGTAIQVDGGFVRNIL